MLTDWPGFEIVENVIAAEECDRLLDAISLTDSSRGRAGVRHLISNQVVRKFAEDERLRSIAERIVERPMIPYKATLFRKTGKANWLVAWHQDTALPVTEAPDCAGWGPMSIKDGIIYAHAPTRALSQIIALRLHLDSSTERNGPLRVLPDSHLQRLETDGDAHGFDVSAEVECLVGKGGVIAMSPLTLHASSKCLTNEPRRVLHIEYAPTLQIDYGVNLTAA